jgi:hypothetical protein
MDPVFVDSGQSILMQIADVAAYLLHLLDWDRLGLSMSAFKGKVVAIARTLDRSLVAGGEPITMKVLS